MTAPTEAEVRKALQRRTELYVNDTPRTFLTEAVERWADMFTDPAARALDPGAEPRGVFAEDDLWGELRPEEARALRRIIAPAIERAKHVAEAAIVEVLVAAALAFGEEYPDAPRATTVERA